jgi:hypothetical protein
MGRNVLRVVIHMGPIGCIAEDPERRDIIGIGRTASEAIMNLNLQREQPTSKRHTLTEHSNDQIRFLGRVIPRDQYEFLMTQHFETFERTVEMIRVINQWSREEFESVAKTAQQLHEAFESAIEADEVAEDE